MMQKIFVGMLCVLVFCCSGCATIMSHGPQTMSIISEPDGADLEIFDVRAGVAIAKAKTPHTATLQRGDGFFLKKYYKISLTKEGYIPETKTITPQISGWYFANLIFGGGLGAIIVDPATGSMWTFYDKQVRFKMYPNTSEGHATKLTDEKARAEAEAKAEQARIASEGSPIQNALAETSKHKSVKIQTDTTTEIDLESSQQTKPDAPAVNSQQKLEKIESDASAENKQTPSQQIQSPPQAVNSQHIVETQPYHLAENPQKIISAKDDSGLRIDLPKTLLVKGKTTKQDVDRDLGKPIEEERSISGEYLYCAYLCTITLPNAPHGSTHKVILKFDNNGILNDYRTKAM